MIPDILDTILELRQNEQRFCVATVLRTADVTSAKAGAKATITDDGQISGHLGGNCVLRAVRLAAASALESTEPRMIRVKPSKSVESPCDGDGVELYKSGCPSGGTVDILIEPYHPPPRVIIFGETPIAKCLAQFAIALGYRTQITLPDEASDEAIDEIDPSDFIVIASQGQGDLAALRTAVRSSSNHISFVASRKKADALLAKLASEGMAHNTSNRIKAPAGLDIGGIDPAEIALSILAEITAMRRGKLNLELQGQSVAQELTTAG